MAKAKRAKTDFEIIEYEGKLVRKYPDGTLRGEHGHIVTQSKERAAELARIRKEAGMDAAREAVAIATKSETFEDGYQKLVAKMVEAVMEDTGRSRTDAMRFLAQATGAYVVNQPQDRPSIHQNAVVINEMPREYYEAMERVLGKLEGEVIDADEG